MPYPGAQYTSLAYGCARWGWAGPRGGGAEGAHPRSGGPKPVRGLDAIRASRSSYPPARRTTPERSMAASASAAQSRAYSA